MRKADRALLALVVIAVIVSVVQVVRPVPSQAATASRAVVAPGRPALPWPAAGESAVAVSGLATILVSGAQVPVPIASLAKIMTAYVVLRDHPLAGQQPGPAIVVSRAQAAAYAPDRANADSVVKVVAGESLTEQQALEALLIPSADNVADILAQWDAGSLSAFVARMNAQARQLGMTRTHYTDPSGLAAATVSTARDQLVLTRSAMAIAAFARIVAMPAATLPVAGTVENFDYDVGHDGIIGVKTGSDSAALGCWAFAARHTIGGAVRTVYGVVLGIPATARGLVEPALAAGESLASAVSAALRPATVLPAGAIVGQVSAAWRATPVPVVTTRAVSGLVLAGARVVFDARMRTPAGDTVRPGQRVGTLVTEGVLGAGRTPLVADRAGRGPGLGWRLLRL